MEAWCGSDRFPWRMPYKDLPKRKGVELFAEGRGGCRIAGIGEVVDERRDEICADRTYNTLQL